MMTVIQLSLYLVMWFILLLLLLFLPLKIMTFSKFLGIYDSFLKTERSKNTVLKQKNIINISYYFPNAFTNVWSKQV